MVKGYTTGCHIYMQGSTIQSHHRRGPYLKAASHLPIINHSLKPIYLALLPKVHQGYTTALLLIKILICSQLTKSSFITMIYTHKLETTTIWLPTSSIIHTSCLDSNTKLNVGYCTYTHDFYFKYACPKYNEEWAQTMKSPYLAVLGVHLCTYTSAT